jgi:hypothetical protein
MFFVLYCIFAWYFYTIINHRCKTVCSILSVFLEKELNLGVILKTGPNTRSKKNFGSMRPGVQAPVPPRKQKQ